MTTFTMTATVDDARGRATITLDSQNEIIKSTLVPLKNGKVRLTTTATSGNDITMTRREPATQVFDGNLQSMLNLFYGAVQRAYNGIVTLPTAPVMETVTAPGDSAQVSAAAD